MRQWVRSCANTACTWTTCVRHLPTPQVQVEQTIESAALAALKVHGRHGRLPTDVTPERLLRLEQELTEKTRALAELSVAFTVLEKKEREASQLPLPASRSRPRRSR